MKINDIISLLHTKPSENVEFLFLESMLEWNKLCLFHINDIKYEDGCYHVSVSQSEESGTQPPIHTEYVFEEDTLSERQKALLTQLSHHH